MGTLLSALGTPRRREILRLVWAGEKGAGEVHRALGDVTFGAVSQHLRVLERSGVLVVRREGRRRIYAARREALGALAPWLETLWSDALYALKLRAELEEARRGPRPGTTARRLGKATARRLGQGPARRRPPSRPAPRRAARSPARRTNAGPLPRGTKPANSTEEGP